MKTTKGEKKIRQENVSKQTGKNKAVRLRIFVGIVLTVLPFIGLKITDMSSRKWQMAKRREG